MAPNRAAVVVTIIVVRFTHERGRAGAQLGLLGFQGQSIETASPFGHVLGHFAFKDSMVHFLYPTTWFVTNIIRSSPLPLLQQLCRHSVYGLVCVARGQWTGRARLATLLRACVYALCSVPRPPRPSECGATAEHRTRDRELPGSELACAIWFFLRQRN